MKLYPNFSMAIDRVQHDLQHVSYEIDNDRWQSSNVGDTPGHKMREVFNTSFTVSLNNDNYKSYQPDINPNLPWADDHFQERVGGEPLNPGVQWANWPYALSANKFRTEGQQFSHTYMERYWPHYMADHHVMAGIRYEYGDLSDVVQHLIDHPESRQAFLPVWFPEDTGVVHGERVPCTLGYHFLIRQGYLHMTYYIRSCDFTRHFRDDLYLSLRLQLWMIEQLNAVPKLKPGMFVFHCVSMHIFENDYKALQS